jgi:hypothetical protein
VVVPWRFHVLVQEEAGDMLGPTEDAIRARAAEFWERDGRQDGRDVEYWLKAALELEDVETRKRKTAEADAAATLEPSIFAPALTLPLIGRVPRLR